MSRTQIYESERVKIESRRMECPSAIPCRVRKLPDSAAMLSKKSAITVNPSQEFHIQEWSDECRAIPWEAVRYLIKFWISPVTTDVTTVQW